MEMFQVGVKPWIFRNKLAQKRHENSLKSTETTIALKVQKSIKEDLSNIAMS